MHSSDNSRQERLAVTGMALVNALGTTVDEVWQNSRAMHSGLRPIRLLQDDPPHFVDPDNFIPGINTYCGVIGHADFHCTRQDLDLPPQDFRAMSISSRLSLLLAKQAIESSGLDKAGYDPQRVGVFISQNSGEAASTLWDLNLSLRARWLSGLAAQVGGWSTEQQEDFQQRLVQGRVSPDESTMLCRLNCTTAGTICQRYGFSGPSFSVGAACSSSMAALYTAFTLIQAGILDAAVVGGGEEGYAPLYVAEFSAIGALARPSEHINNPEDYSRPFDLYRNGFVLGEGGVMLVLEREDRARTRTAPMHGLITSVSSTTNTSGLIEPSAHFQAQAIKQSFAALDYGPEAVDLVECHATATPMGDLAEAQSLTECFGHKRSPTILSGYKGQIGHTTGASGLISLVHGLCAMKEGLYPGTLNCTTPDPALDLDKARLRVLSAPEPWELPDTGIRRMQVNTFGFGGSCFVAQLEEPNDRKSSRLQTSGAAKTSPMTPNFQGQEELVDGVRLVTLPHKGQLWRLGATTPAWMNELGGLPSNPSPADITALSRRGLWLSPPTEKPPLAMMCCGQGSVWPGMGRALYDTFPAAREAMDRIAKVADWDILGLMDESSLDKIILTRWQQPYLFLLEYAQAHYLHTLGLKPTVMSGHSLGELIALCLAGVYTPETAWTILDTRSRHMAKLEEEASSETGMMSVHCTSEVLEATLKEWPELHVSNYNSPMQVILSGPRPLLQEVRKTLRKRRIPAILLNVSLAFHHPHMRALRDVSIARLLKLDFQAPQMPMMSNITTGLYPNTKTEIVDYIADLDENSVRWVECVHNMWRNYNIRHFVEVGPADTLCGLVSDIEGEAVCVASSRKDKEVEAMRTAVARLYALGQLPLRAGHGGNQRPIPQQEKPAPQQKSAAAAPASYEEHIEKVMPIIAQATGYTREELQPDMDLRHDLSIRSSRFPLIMHEAEQQFQIKLRFEDMLGVATIRDLAEVLRTLQQNGTQQGFASAEARDEARDSAEARDAAKSRAKIAPRLPVLRYAPQWQPLCLTEAAPVSAARILVVGAPQHTAPHVQNLRTLYGAAHIEECAAPEAAQRLLQAAEPAAQRGLLVVLPPATADMQAEAAPLTAVRLGEYFSLIKEFCKGKGAQFCMVVQQQALVSPADHGDTASLLAKSVPFSDVDGLAAGLDGLLLSAALEYPACLFRSVRLGDNPAHDWLAQVLSPATEGAPRPVQWLCAAHGALNPQLQVQALDPALPLTQTAEALPIQSGDIVLVPGGAKGISPHMLTALGPWACTFVLLGRSTTSEDAEENVALARLRALGSVVEHYSCDVSDAAAVQQTVQAIMQKHGRIDALIYAAGITRDATLDALDAAAFNAVVQVKYQGLWHCLEACRPVGLRYAVAFSSLAAWLGNYGQANYCAANRAMTALLHSYGHRYGISTRALWLPPILGAGMAAGSDMQEQMRLRGLENACLYCEELGDLLARDLFCGTQPDILWARLIPAVPHVTAPVPLSPHAQHGLLERPAHFPLVFPLHDCTSADATAAAEGEAAKLQETVFVGGMQISRYSEHWPGLQAGNLPLTVNVPEVLLLEALTEGAVQHCPWLRPCGIRKFVVHDVCSCQGGITREACISSHVLPWDMNSATLLRVCNTRLQVHALSVNGRRQANLNDLCQGDVILTAAAAPLCALWEPMDSPVAAEGKNSLTYLTENLTLHEKEHQNSGEYVLPLQLLTALFQASSRACAAQGRPEARMKSIDEIFFSLQNTVSTQILRIELRAAGDSAQTALHFDGQIIGTDGVVYSTVRGLIFT